MVLEEIDSKYEVVQEAAYYPFGMAIPSQSFALPDENDNYQNRYIYNGKEYQDDFGLNWYDYGVRFYDAQIGRFHAQDRFAEMYYHMTPYQYGGNNPIYYIDINGDSLHVSIASNQAWNAFRDIVNAGFEGQFRVVAQAAEGEGNYYLFVTATEGGGDVGQLSDEGLAFYNEMVDITSGDGVAKVSLVWDKSDVNVGNYRTGEVDMADISAFNIGGNSVDMSKPVGATQQGKLIHEVREQYEKGRAGYTGDQGYRSSHARAIGAENAVNGNIRLTNREGFTRGNKAVRQYFREKDGTITTVVYSINSRRMAVEQRRPTGVIR
jgi:RHS repeat-associated protein